MKQWGKNIVGRELNSKWKGHVAGRSMKNMKDWVKTQVAEMEREAGMCWGWGGTQESLWAS